jgi:hypothetical protein
VRENSYEFEFVQVGGVADGSRDARNRFVANVMDPIRNIRAEMERKGASRLEKFMLTSLDCHETILELMAFWFET